VPQVDTESRLSIDTQAVVTAQRDDFGKLKTLRRSIQEIAGDGKLVNLPAQEEHVLFESSMYICTHVYGSASGSRISEVYLWAGAEVSDAAADDAFVLAKRVAKEAGAGQRSAPSITVIRQAREPAAFCQALGGILIVRRGSRASTSTKPYVLCGRSHMGHVAFDETDRNLTSLCSGYPYIVVKPVSLQHTRVFLWKGKDCSPEVLGSARLISMDLDSSGSITEVEQGNESADFLSVFPPGTPLPDPSFGEQTTPIDLPTPRLFRIDALEPRRSSSSFLWATSLISRARTSASRPTSSASNSSSTLAPADQGAQQATPRIEATELLPFTQSDLEPEHISILDANQAIYVLPGPLFNTSHHWQTLLAQACMFANEYAMLVASVEKRSAVPQAEMWIEDIPREARMVFRRWGDRRGLWGTGGMMAGKVSGGGDEGGRMISVLDVLDVICR